MVIVDCGDCVGAVVFVSAAVAVRVLVRLEEVQLGVMGSDLDGVKVVLVLGVSVLLRAQSLNVKSSYEDISAESLYMIQGIAYPGFRMGGIWGAPWVSLKKG